LEGVRLAVASNKFQAGTEALIRRFFSDIPFVKILGNAPGLPLKPDPEVIRLAIAAGVATGQRLYSAAAVPERSRRAREWTPPRSGGEPTKELVSAVMVGDSGTDIRTARNAGIPAIAVSWGFRPRADLEIADAIADTPGQLKDFIRIFTQKN